jgi:signal transduction histidine kinase
MVFIGKWFLFFFLLLASTISETISQASGNEIILNQSTKLSNIGKHILVYQDTSNSLSFEAIQQGATRNKFEAVQKEVPGFGINEVTVWVKIDLKNSSERTVNDYIEIAFPTLDSVFYYQKNESGLAWQEFFASDRIPFSERLIPHKNIVFPLIIAPKSSSTVYFKVRNKGSIILPINIMPQQALYSDDLAEELAFGIFYGIMLVMLVYNLLLAFTARSITYVYYVGIIAGNLFTLSALNGHAFQYIWGEVPWWANHVIIFGIGLWILSGNLFAASFLDARGGKRALFIAFRIMKLLGLLIIVSTFVLDYKDSLLIANFGLIFNCFFLLFMGITYRLMGVKVAGIFSVAWTLYLLGVLLYTLRNLGVLPVNVFTSHILEIGAISEVLLLSVSLGYKYRLLELDKNLAQQNSLDTMTRSQEMVQQQNELLERSIQERTAELNLKQQEGLTQNAILNEQNSQLLEAQTIIQDQNTQLHKYNENLEIKVSQRTADLKDTNQELAENVQKLEQYAFMTAHNLRAPVARLLGLTQLLDMDPNVDKSEWINILSLVKEEGRSLDAVINDLNAILEIRKTKDHITKKVNLEEITDQVKRILKDSLEKNSVSLNIDFSELGLLRTNPTYIESILYNLVSNAIKYRDVERKPIISIKSYQQGQHKVIEIADNGIGIDLEKYGDDLFGMYKRFHTHVDGKGLGLFLVKSQVEILGGKIEVNSKTGGGTTFKLFFV